MLRATLVPSKSGADDSLKVRALRTPAEPLGCAARIGYKHRRVTRSPGDLAPGDRPPRDRFGRGNHFAYRMTPPRPEIERRALAPGAKMLKRAHWASARSST